MDQGIGRSAGDNGESDMRPPVVPEHQLIRRVGRGSFGDVWLARGSTGAWRAVKCVRRIASGGQRSFEREFEGLLAFEPISRTHPGYVNILQVGRDDHAGFLYYVMELADDQESGREVHPARYRPRTVRSLIEGGRGIPPKECARIGRELAGALEHLHAQGLVHRDIKPSNIIFVDGQPKLADIGLVAKADSTVTFVGTEGYVPPEGPGTARADLYSLGKILYELSTGLDRRDFPELPSGFAGLPDRRVFLDLNAVINRACARDPHDRYASAAALCSDLDRIAAGQNVRRFRLRCKHSIALGALALVAVIATLGFVLGRTAVRHDPSRNTHSLVPSTNSEPPPRSAAAEPVIEPVYREPVAQVAGRGRHTVALTASGRLLAWGDNALGQLGTGDHAARPWPTPVGQATNWIGVDTGDSFTLALRADGSVWAWGGNSFGELGDGSDTPRALPAQVGMDRDWREVQAGQHNAYAVKQDGSWWGWGRNDKGQLLRQTDAHVRAPVQVASPGTWQAVSVSYEHAVAISHDGGLWTWGDSACGRLGRPVDKSPVYAPGLLFLASGWSSVGTGFGHAIALRDNGALWGWGWNPHGQLGLGDTRTREAPVRLGADSDWVRVCAASEHTVALKADGTLWAWGAGNQGEIGDGARLDRFNPVRVNAEANWVRVPPTAGNTSFAIKLDGSLWGWGFNRFGQLGDGTFETRVRPVQILPREP